MRKLLIFSICFIFILSLEAQNRRTTSTSPSKKEQEAKAEQAKKEEQAKKGKQPTKVEKAPTKAKEEDITTNKAPQEYSGKAFLNPSSNAMKMSTVVEFGAYPSDADITVINIYGHLGLNFDVARRFHVGPYFRYKIASTHEYQVIQYRNIDYDVSSLKDWGTGVCFGAYFPLGTFMLINPELRVGYNEFTIQHPNYTDSANNFIYRNYVNFTPRVNFGFKLSDYAIINLHGGYTLPYLINDSEKVPHYDPATFHYGVGLRFYLTK